MRKSIVNPDEWSKVLSELEGEFHKLQSYDETIIKHLGNISGKRILDYGCGPAVAAKLLQQLGADISVYEISEKMLEIASAKLGESAVFHKVDDIPDNYYDIVWCSLVLCIVDETMIIEIMKNLEMKVSNSGKIYIGLCNPKIYDIEETNLDFRFPKGESYSCNHDYKKIKKEGNYEIIERHRPIEWYLKVIEDVDLKVSNILFTPEYELKGFKIRDFIIFELMK